MSDAMLNDVMQVAIALAIVVIALAVSRYSNRHRRFGRRERATAREHRLIRLAAHACRNDPIPPARFERTRADWCRSRAAAGSGRSPRPSPPPATHARRAATAARPETP